MVVTFVGRVVASVPLSLGDGAAGCQGEECREDQGKGEVKDLHVGDGLFLTLVTRLDRAEQPSSSGIRVAQFGIFPHVKCLGAGDQNV